MIQLRKANHLLNLIDPGTYNEMKHDPAQLRRAGHLFNLLDPGNYYLLNHCVNPSMKMLVMRLQPDIKKMVSKFNIPFTFMFSSCILSTRYTHFIQQPHLHNHLVTLSRHLEHEHPSAHGLNNHLVFDQTQYLLHRHLRSITIIKLFFYSEKNTESIFPPTQPS